MSAPSRQADELAAAVKVLARLGAVFQLPEAKGSLSLRAAAARLDVSADWLRDHLEEFPNWWRLPAGSVGERNVGELRIPVRDLDAFERTHRGRRE